jgi:hypothetical protein
MSRPECPAEGAQQSEHSPGPIDDREPIVYILVDPLTSQAGTVKDLLKSKLKQGTLSVCRCLHCSAAEANAAVVVPLTAGTLGRSFQGALWATANRIRDIRLGMSDVGAFCLVDDGKPDYRAHAHLAYSPADEKLRNAREAARANLKAAFLENGIQPSLATCPFFE